MLTQFRTTLTKTTILSLVNEDGEAIEGVRDDMNNKVVFKIPHFSSYYYDNYDY